MSAEDQPQQPRIVAGTRGHPLESAASLADNVLRLVLRTQPRFGKTLAARGRVAHGRGAAELLAKEWSQREGDRDTSGLHSFASIPLPNPVRVWVRIQVGDGALDRTPSLLTCRKHGCRNAALLRGHRAQPADHGGVGRRMERTMCGELRLPTYPPSVSGCAGSRLRRLGPRVPRTAGLQGPSVIRFPPCSKGLPQIQEGPQIKIPPLLASLNLREESAGAARAAPVKTPSVFGYAGPMLHRFGARVLLTSSPTTLRASAARSAPSR